MGQARIDFGLNGDRVAGMKKGAVSCAFFVAVRVG
jgi:tetrahydromethanopterin S-methyltransferase subunit F